MISESSSTYILGNEYLDFGEYEITYGSNCGYTPTFTILGAPDFVQHQIDSNKFSVFTSDS